MTWEELKLALSTLYPQYIGSGKLIDNTDNGVTPSALAILVNLVNNRISGYPLDFNCLREVYTLTLTASSTYNLRTLVPGLKTVYQLYGIDSNQQHSFYGNAEANLTPVDGWSVRGNSLYFTGTTPTGTALLQYKSKYLVKTVADVRQQYFLADTDYSALDDDDINVLVFGVGQYITWNSDSENQDRKTEVNNWFKESFNNMILNNKNSNQLNSMM